MVDIKSAINFNEVNKSLITPLLTLLCLGPKEGCFCSEAQQVNYVQLRVRLLCRRAGLRSLPGHLLCTLQYITFVYYTSESQGIEECYPYPASSQVLWKIERDNGCEHFPPSQCGVSSFWACVWISPAIHSSITCACLDEKCTGHGEFRLHGGRVRFWLLP